MCIRRPLESAEHRWNGLLFWRPLENTRPRPGRAGVRRFGRSSAVDTFEKSCWFVVEFGFVLRAWKEIKS